MQDIALRSIAESVAHHGWPEGLERAVRCFEDRGAAHRVQYDLWLRHTAWKALFDPRHRAAAWVCDPGCGSLAISLAHDFDRVHAFCENPDSAAVARARTARLGLSNIEFEDRPDAPGEVDAAAIYCVPGRAPDRDLIAAAHARLAPHGRLYIAVTGSRGNLNAWRTLRLLQRLFANVIPYRCHTTGGLEQTYELQPGSHPAFLRSLLRGHAFGLLALKDSSTDSLLGCVLGRVEQRLLDGAAIKPERLVFASPNGLTVLARCQNSPRRFVIRIPLDNQSSQRNQANRRALEATEGLEVALWGRLPRLALSDSVCDSPFSVETALPGVPAGTFVVRREDGVPAVTAALDWITALHARTAKRCPAGGEPIKRLVTAPLDRAFEAFRFPQWRAGFDHLRRLLTAALQGSGLPLVFSHGDYSVDNVLLSTNPLRVTGVIDWDLSAQNGLPLLDVFYFLATAARTMRSQPIGTVFREIVFPMRFGAAETAALERYCNALAIPKHLLAPLAVLTWLHHAGVRLENPERYRFTADGIESGADAFPAALALLQDSAGRFSTRSATA